VTDLQAFASSEVEEITHLADLELRGNGWGEAETRSVLSGHNTIFPWNYDHAQLSCAHH